MKDCKLEKQTHDDSVRKYGSEGKLRTQLAMTHIWEVLGKAMSVHERREDDRIDISFA